MASINRLFFHFLKKVDLVIPTAFFNKNIMMFGRCLGDRHNKFAFYFAQAIA
ncbi:MULTISPECIES: hypothetical protein [Fischerella]|uniref:hypothetical protein n=1 Tax=Fischerella TaxID=1190 RepID=UPI000A6905E2|nr:MULTISPECIES: hypothetical protein [Fischerella]